MSRKRFERPRPQRETRKLYVVATEGKRTEQIYFSVFNNEDFRKNVRIQILPTRSGESSPGNVLKRLRKYTQDIGVQAGDELWVVVDVDSWGEQALNELCQECSRAGYNVAISNPCFELWLVLHQEQPRTPPIAKECERELERLLGRYDKSEYDVKKLLPYIESAIRNAQRLDKDQEESWPHNDRSLVQSKSAYLLFRHYSRTPNMSLADTTPFYYAKAFLLCEPTFV